MGNCRDCKWWDTDARRTALKIFREPGQTMRASGAVGACLMTEIDSAPVHPESSAQIWESDEFSGVLVTREDFGCVQFEAKAE
jgi:hypothetical protein